jgi:hypothetical protein
MVKLAWAWTDSAQIKPQIKPNKRLNMCNKFE